MAVIKQNNVFDLIEKLCVMEAELELGGPLAENWQQIEFSAMNQQPEDVEQDEDEEIDVIGISDEENVVDVQVYDNIEIEEENEAADMGRFNNVIIVDDDPDVINIDNVNISDLILEGSDEELAHQELIEFLENKNEEYLMIPRRRYRQGTPDTENNIDGNSEEEHFTNGSSDSESDDDFVDWKRLQNLVNRPKRTLKKVKNPILMKKKNVALRKERYRMLQMALEKLDGK